MNNRNINDFFLRSIVSANAVVTAAHALFENGRLVDPSLITVLVGCDDLSKGKLSQ